MPPKKAAAKGKDDKKAGGTLRPPPPLALPQTLTDYDPVVLLKIVKEALTRHYAALQVPADASVLARVDEALNERTGKLVFQGDKPSPAHIRAVALALRELHDPIVKNILCPIRSLCLWRVDLGDEGGRTIVSTPPSCARSL
jgi:hypothetical protein